MGYSTYFDGEVKVTPALNEQEVEFLRQFSESRRMNRTTSPYYVAGSGPSGQGHEDNIIDYNTPPPGQPGLWCGWTALDENTIGWNEEEKFYASADWMKYIIQHFIGRNPLAKAELPFLQGHVCNGQINAQGDDSEDVWSLIVRDGKVLVQGYISVPDGNPKEL